MLNNCNFTGRFAFEPKYFESDKGNRCVFRLAVDRDRKTEDGNYGADFLDFVVWGKTADFVVKYFHKGDLATVSGARAQVREYKDGDGVMHRNVEFVPGEIYFGQFRHKEE